MLPGGLDDMYRQALGTSHTPYLLVEILDGNGNVLLSGPTYMAGNVSATLTSRVARRCSVTFDESFYPYNPDDLLAPYGNMIRATRGVEFADGNRHAWTVFVGRIQNTTLNTDGTCTAQAADFAADVIDARFLNPTNSQPGEPVSNEVTRLIATGVPDATFGTYDVDDIPTQALTWQLDRGQALDELASSVSAFWYPLANGDFVLRRYAWTVAAPSVVTYADGDGGSVISSSASRSRDEVFNSLTVTGERLNGDAPVYATASDDNPASATFINGPFGRRHQMMRLQTPASLASAQAAARGNLRRLTALVDAWSWTMTVDAALELGDVVTLQVRGRPDIIQVVSSMDIPLDLSSPMTVSARAQVIGVLEGVS